MKTTQKLDWNDAGPIEDRTDGVRIHRALVVADGVIASVAALPDGMSIKDALADYAAGYDAGEENVGATITGSWELWEDGEMRDQDEWSFEAQRS